MMGSHFWLLVVTVAVCATVSYGEPIKKLPQASDYKVNKMLPPKYFGKNGLLPKQAMVADTKNASKEEYDDEDYAYYDDSYDTDSESNEIAEVPKKQPSTVKPEKIDAKPKSSITKAPVTTAVPQNTAAALDADKVKNNKKGKWKFVDENDSDIEEDDDDEDDDDDDDNNDDDEIIETDTNECPRDCVCNRNMNGYMVATCNRLDAGIQKFSSSITDLEVIDVSQKFPIILGENFFKKVGLERVSTIKILNSHIVNIHPKAFEGLKELYSVNMINSDIGSLHPDTFAGNARLRLLTLDNNDLSQMQSESAVSNYLLKAPAIEELSLSGCNLKRLLPTAFDRLENIVFINLSNNQIQSLPEKLFQRVKNIEELDLSSNNITTLAENIFKNTTLSILNLRYNHIESKLDFATSDIQRLDLSFNNVTNIASTMFTKMTGLTSLILKGNGITKIQSDAFAQLRSLRQIDLSFNELEQLSSKLFSTNRDLDVIRLNDNYRLKSLPLEGFTSNFGRYNVYLFDLSNCDISELSDDTFKNMPLMKTLNLAWNNFETVTTDFFKTMPGLIELNLSNNIISEIGNLTFLFNLNLKKLNLAGNPLQRVSPRMFLPLKELTELDMSNCNLADIWSESIMTNVPISSVLKNLKVLNISNNNIVHARHSHFATLEKLEVLDLSNNHLHCDEGFKSLIEWLKERKITAGNTHLNFNAKLIERGAVAEVMSMFGWDTFENNTCAQSHPVNVVKPSNVEPSSTTEKNQIINYVDEDDEDIDDDEDEQATNKKPGKEGNGELNEGIENEYNDEDDENDDEISLPPIEQKPEIMEEIDSLNTRIEYQTKALALFNEYAPILLILLCMLTTLTLGARIVSLFMHRRGERYRQALLASKGSIIYQKLSEEINTPQTPKIHRYAPINQV